ncbi:MAG: SAM-dependent methyltransferase [Candidatus Hydrogenedens sp.]|nr:SAM-dependent methyltransferase [Candidatus Hydrogenedens sp.]
MAGLFPRQEGHCRLLDAGAGIGSLSAAFLERWRSGELAFSRIDLDAFEIDDALIPHLEETLSAFRRGGALRPNVVNQDFVLAASRRLADALFDGTKPRYTHAILNPPYKKIGSTSQYRIALRSAGIETVNLYAGFVALAVALMAPGGQIVAIIPRSFCNGPYYRPFREFLLDRTAIRHIHLFNARNKAFKDDDVLQENIIIRLERSGCQGPVSISTSTDDSFSDLEQRNHDFDEIVFDGDLDRYIHVPTSARQSGRSASFACNAISRLGISVSTGPVVDFRLREHLCEMPETGTVPLLYPCHFSGYGISWPLSGNKKPNAIRRNADTEKWLYPNGYYCVVRRFSSKEEKRRLVAAVVDPDDFNGASMVGFENHLNVFHFNRSGLPEPIARGLSVFLNSTMVDDAFRQFSGHTQVNVSDLKRLDYPSLSELERLGKKSLRSKSLTQADIDEMVRSLVV